MSGTSPPERGPAAIDDLLHLQIQLLDERLRRLEDSLVFRLSRTVGRQLARLSVALGYRKTDRAELARYGGWLAADSGYCDEIRQAALADLARLRRPRISLLLLAEAGQEAGPADESLRSQILAPDEVVLVQNGPGMPFPARLSRAVAEAGGDFLLFLQAGDRLRPDAVFRFVEALQGGDFDLIYADHDAPAPGGRGRVPVLKPAWSPAMLRNTFYIGFPLLVRRGLLRAAEAPRSGSGSSSLHEWILRVSGKARVGHIPRVLLQSGSAGPAGPAHRSSPLLRHGSSVHAVICSRSAGLLAECLSGLRRTAGSRLERITVVGHGEGTTLDEVRRVTENFGAALEPYSGPFHFARMCNLGARDSAAPWLLFLNDDVSATVSGWLDVLARHLEEDGVAVAGAVLRYPDGSLQHGGLVVGMGDGVGHPGKGYHDSRLWPWLWQTHEVSAVTGACMLVRRDVFEKLGGFDLAFPNNYNDADFCLRARAAGWRVVACAVDGLFHKECQTRAAGVRPAERLRFLSRWSHQLAQVDPYYSPALAPTEEIRLRRFEEFPWPLQPGAPDDSGILWKVR